MNKEIAVILALAGLFIGYIIWRELVPTVGAAIPAAAPAPVDESGPSYLIYNTGATPGGPTFNPGPPVSNGLVMPKMTAGLAGVADCGCDARGAGRF